MKELNVINRLEYHRDVFKKSSVTYQDMQDAINCIIGLKAENEALKQRLELLSEMEKEMRDLISRKALANELQKYFVNNTIHKNDLAEAIAKQPIAEAKPVVHGKWEECDWVEYDGHVACSRYPKVALRCSECHNAFKKELLWKNNFCPNCGADMRKKVQE